MLNNKGRIDSHALVGSSMKSFMNDSRIYNSLSVGSTSIKSDTPVIAAAGSQIRQAASTKILGSNNILNPGRFIASSLLQLVKPRTNFFKQGG